MSQSKRVINNEAYVSQCLHQKNRNISNENLTRNLQELEKIKKFKINRRKEI